MNEDTSRDAATDRGGTDRDAVERGIVDRDAVERGIIDRDALDRAEAGHRAGHIDRDVDVDPEVAVDPTLRDPTLRDADFDVALTGASDTSATLSPDSIADIRDTGGDLEPDFMDQEVLTDPVAAAGPSDGPDDPAADADEVYTPPTDPVVTANPTGQLQVLGGFAATSAESIDVARSASDNQLGDEAIEDAIRQALQEDAATTDLRVEVLVRQGVARLRGTVADLDDVENAESVAARVPGVREVVEELEVAEL